MRDYVIVHSLDFISKLYANNVDLYCITSYIIYIKIEC